MNSQRMLPCGAGLLLSFAFAVSAQPAPLCEIPVPAMPSALILTQSPTLIGAPAEVVVPPLPTGLVIAPCSGCPEGKKVCSGRTETHAVPKAVYTAREVEFCVPRSGLHALFLSGDCDKTCAGNPRTKKVLVKKMVSEEKSHWKCEPSLPPAALAPTSCAPGEASCTPRAASGTPAPAINFTTNPVLPPIR